MRPKTRIGVLAALCAAAFATTAAVTLPASGAGMAACSASDAAIYTPPASVHGTPGTVLACTPVSLTQVPGSISMNAWKMQYVSTDVRDTPVAVSGIVAVPTSPWTGPGARPVVSFHFGTLGLGTQCAFSKQLAGAYQDEYEGDQIAAILKAGWAVAATDDIGYLDGGTHTYMVGRNMGHATLDAVRAAFRVPGAGLNSRTKVGLWGYSQGGAASLWAAQLAAGYAPDLNVVADASGGVPADLRQVAAASDGGVFAGFSVDATIGMSVAYPNLPFNSLMNAKGQQLIAQLKTLCLLGTVAAGNGAKSADLTVGGLSFSQLYQVAGSDGITWGQVVDAQKLGAGVGPTGSSAQYRIGFPVLQYHGALDEVIPPAVEDAVHVAYCQAGITTQQNVYLSDHALTDNQAVNDVVSWLSGRFAGMPTSGNC